MDEQNETFCAIYLSFLTKNILQICTKVAIKIQLVQVLSSIWRSENCIMHIKHNISNILTKLVIFSFAPSAVPHLSSGTFSEGSDGQTI